MKRLTGVSVFAVFFIIFTTSIVSAADYLIAPGDEIEIFIWNNPDLTRHNEVKMDGSIAMPLVGKVPAEGLTTKELEEQLASEFREYLKQPEISVVIVRHSRWVVSIFGEVQRQTGREIPYYKSMGLLELVARVGGVTKDANIKNCVVLRKSHGDAREKIDVDLDAILSGKSDDFKLEVGDVVYIPHTRLTSWNYFVRNVMPTLSFIASLVTMTAILF